MRATGLEPSVPYPGAQAQWPCVCIGCGAAVTPRYYNIKNGWGGCRKCKHAAQSIYQLKPETEAVATMRTAGLEPKEPYPGRQVPWLCQCASCGKSVSPRLNAILNGQGGCKWCAKRAVDPNVAADIMRSAGLVPQGRYPGSRTPWPCNCVKCQRTVTPSYGKVAAGQAGCRWCSLQENNGKSQRLDSDVAYAYMVTRGLKPLEPYDNARSPWRCECMTCGAEVTPRYGNIKAGSGGCGSCFPRGFDPKLPAMVYLVAHQQLGAAKVGVSREGGYRLREHLSRGWQVLVQEPLPGDRALRVEKEILSYWRNDLRLPPFLGKQEMSQGGWSETVDLDAVDIVTTIVRIKQLAAV